MLMKQKKQALWSGQNPVAANYKGSLNSAVSKIGGLDIVQFAIRQDQIEPDIISYMIVLYHIWSDRL